MTRFDIIRSADYTAYWETLEPSRQDFLLERYFPNKKQLGISMSYIKGATGLGVLLKPSAFDVGVIPRIRQGFEKAISRMPFFKESYYVDEELRQDLNTFLQNNNTSQANFILQNIFDDAQKLLESAGITREVMRAQVLTQGQIMISGNGQLVEFDYGLAADQRGNASVAWTDTANSDPIGDIEQIIDHMSLTYGTDVETALLNNNTWRLLRLSESVKRAYLWTANLFTATNALTQEQVRSVFASLLGINFVVYIKGYIDSLGQPTKYIPDNVVAFFPDEQLGNTVFGTTPEESDLMTGASNADVTITDVGVAVTVMRKSDPVQTEIKVSQIVQPSFEQQNRLFILDVGAAA